MNRRRLVAVFSAFLAILAGRESLASPGNTYGSPCQSGAVLANVSTGELYYCDTNQHWIPVPICYC